jgi:hypothetical protein
MQEILARLGGLVGKTKTNAVNRVEADRARVGETEK